MIFLLFLSSLLCGYSSYWIFTNKEAYWTKGRKALFGTMCLYISLNNLVLALGKLP